MLKPDETIYETFCQLLSCPFRLSKIELKGGARYRIIGLHSEPGRA